MPEAGGETVQGNSRVVVCTGGFHIDNMKPEQIDEVVKALDGLADEIVSGIAGAGHSPLSTGF